MKELYENALREAIEITEKNLDAFIDTFPHVSTNNRYHGEEECAVDFFLLSGHVLSGVRDHRRSRVLKTYGSGIGQL